MTSHDGNRYVVKMIYGRYVRISRHHFLQPLSAFFSLR
jgi:hypothetical protein